MNWPQTLEAVNGPFRPARITGSADGMGRFGPTTRSLAEHGLVTPDLMCGLTLFLLAGQPKPAGSSDTTADDNKASPIAGGVWVREQFTIHRPLGIDEVFTVAGESTGRFVRKGRRYGTTSSQTVNAEGRPVATNLTTGLLSYRAEPGAADSSEGLALDETPTPQPDSGAAPTNPHLGELAAATVGQCFGGDEVTISLPMMAARDTANPDNPIHSDLEAARAAGLERPIAGGSHVLAFALEPLLAAWGPESLSHGAHFDIRWKAPTHCDTVIATRATVTEADNSQVVLNLEVTLRPDASTEQDQPPSRTGAGEPTTALVGTLTVPIAQQDPDPDSNDAR